MERKPYSAGAVKFSFWFMEFRKTVQLLSEGKSFADIKKLNEETNGQGCPSKDSKDSAMSATRPFLRS